jgi:fructose-bisphosphate aldolase class II
LSLRAVVGAVVELRSPLIVQTLVKTVKSVGRDVPKAMFDATVASVPVPVPVPVARHLDHCPDREVISSCLAAGWNPVLFDASALPVEAWRLPPGLWRRPGSMCSRPRSAMPTACTG